MESPLRKATKGYKQQETLLGKHDLSPPIKNPSPLEIEEELKYVYFRTDYLREEVNIEK